MLRRQTFFILNVEHIWVHFAPARLIHFYTLYVITIVSQSFKYNSELTSLLHAAAQLRAGSQTPDHIMIQRNAFFK